MPTLDTLPMEMLNSILSYTSSGTRHQLSSTCRQLNAQVALTLYREVTLNVRAEKVGTSEESNRRVEKHFSNATPETDAGTSLSKQTSVLIRGVLVFPWFNGYIFALLTILRITHMVFHLVANLYDTRSFNPFFKYFVILFIKLDIKRAACVMKPIFNRLVKALFLVAQVAQLGNAPLRSSAGSYTPTELDRRKFAPCR